MPPEAQAEGSSGAHRPHAQNARGFPSSGSGLAPRRAAARRQASPTGAPPGPQEPRRFPRPPERGVPWPGRSYGPRPRHGVYFNPRPRAGSLWGWRPEGRESKKAKAGSADNGMLRFPRNSPEFHERGARGGTQMCSLTKANKTSGVPKCEALVKLTQLCSAPPGLIFRSDLQ